MSTMIRSHSSRGPELAELLHRHVLLRAGEAGRQRLVEGVRPGSARARSGSACASTISSKVRFMSSIMACSSPSPSTPSTRRGVLSSSVEAHGLRQPPGGVDGEHDDVAAALGRAQAERRRGGGLADAAGAAADDDPGARVVEERVEVEDRRRPGARRVSGCGSGSCRSLRRSSDSRQLVQPGQVHPSASSGSSYHGQAQPRPATARCSRLQLGALGVLGGLLGEPSHQPRREPPSREPGRLRPSAELAGSNGRSRPASRAAVVQQRLGRTMFTKTPPDGQAGRAQLGDAVQRSPGPASPPGA